MVRNLLQGMIDWVSRKKSRAVRRRARRRSLTVFALRLLSRSLLLFILFSILLILPFRWLPPPTSSLMLQRTFQEETRQASTDSLIYYRWVPYEDIAPHMPLAAIAGEDQKFPLHGGFDFEAIRLALRDRMEGKPLRGASTISQQLVKNLYLWPERSLLRKGLEAWLTMLLEVLWPKKRILEVYLNIVEFGPQTFGVQAASQRFFHKPAAHLTPREAALLAAVLPNPLYYEVDSPGDHVRRRQAWILQQMRQLGGLRYLEKL